MKKKRLLQGIMLTFCGMLLFSSSTCGSSNDDDDNNKASSKLSVSPTSLKFDATGATKAVTVNSDYLYVGADVSVDWLDYDYDDLDGVLLITAEPNNTTESRETNIIIMGSNDGNKILDRVTVRVEQEPGTGTQQGGKTAREFLEELNASKSLSEKHHQYLGGHFEGEVNVTSYYEYDGEGTETTKKENVSFNFGSDSNGVIDAILTEKDYLKIMFSGNTAVVKMDYQDDMYIYNAEMTVENIDAPISSGKVNVKTLDLYYKYGFKGNWENSNEYKLSASNLPFNQYSSSSNTIINEFWVKHYTKDKDASNKIIIKKEDKWWVSGYKGSVYYTFGSAPGSWR